MPICYMLQFQSGNVIIGNPKITLVMTPEYSGYEQLCFEKMEELSAGKWLALADQDSACFGSNEIRYSNLRSPTYSCGDDIVINAGIGPNTNYNVYICCEF